MADDKISLAGINSGRSGTIVEIQGGYGLVSRLAAMGIIPGKKVTKISAMLWRGPLTVEIDRAKIAIGYGMASRIIVKPD